MMLFMQAVTSTAGAWPPPPDSRAGVSPPQAQHNDDIHALQSSEAVTKRAPSDALQMQVIREGTCPDVPVGAGASLLAPTSPLAASSPRSSGGGCLVSG